MMRRYYRARISLAEMKKAIASASSTVLGKSKEDEHIPGVVSEIEVETSNASEVQGIEKSISI